MHRVTALVHPPQATFELACPAEVFGTERGGGPGRYEFGVCAERPGPVATTAGYDLLVVDGLAALDRADTVVVPGWLPVGQRPSPAVLAALRRAHRRGARLVSICSGAFPLAFAGLLDGRTATTHWARADELAAAFPAVTVDPDRLYVDHGDVATSAGSSAGIDLCLHLVRSDHGADYAARIARTMVLAPHREGGQRPYAPPRAAQLEESLGPLLAWATGRLAEPLTLAALADRAGTSPRTLARRFVEQVGESPGRWLLGQRVRAARELLESSDLPIEAVARRVGLSSATNLRRRFRDLVGVAPGAYRRTFRTPGP